MKDIQMIPIKSVIPYANNPRNNKAAVDILDKQRKIVYRDEKE